MLSSEYRDRFALYRQSFEVDEWGDQQPTETIVYEGYCKPVNLTGSEYWSAYEQHMETTMKFYCRYALQFEGLDTVGLRLRWRGRDFDVMSIDNVESRNFDCTIKAKAVE